MQRLLAHCRQEPGAVGDSSDLWRGRVHRWLEKEHGAMA
jgi:hypothetical protein